MDYCEVEWLALKINQDHSVVFEIAPKYCISDSIVDYDGYSISSKGFLPTAAAKSLQSCLILCDPIDGSPLGPSVFGILQTRILQWVAISFSSA